MAAEAKEKKGYQVPMGEEDYAHLQICRNEYDQNTGKPKFMPFIHKCNRVEYGQFLENPNGLDINEVLHLPKGWPTPQKWAKEKEAKLKKK